MSEIITTSNGIEIAHPTEKMTEVGEFKKIAEAYGLNGENPAQRAESFRGMTNENIAFMLADINRKLQGSDDTLVRPTTHEFVKANIKLVAPENRYDVFTSFLDKAREARDINPARLGDAIALATVMLYPFEDGNGRTARAVAFLFRDNIDGADAQEDFEVITESRDAVRARSGFLIDSYIPVLNAGEDQSSPAVVNNFLERALVGDERLYTGPWSQAPAVSMSGGQ